MLNDCSENAPMAPYPEWTLDASLAGTGLQRFVGHGREQPAQDETAEADESCEPALHAPRRWGLAAEAVAHLGDRLYQFWLRFRGGFTTRTRDTSEHAYNYLRAQLTMDTERNFANMDRTLEFIPIKSWVTTGAGAPGNCAGHSRVPSPDHGCPLSTGGAGLSPCDTA
jgi:hypothetical protein